MMILMAKRELKSVRAVGFSPVATTDARVLVLGSMPSVASLAKQQYHGHPSNAFGLIMGELFGARPELPYEERRRIVCDQGLAVWDVLRACHREGSLDAAIRRDTERPNDFVTFFREHPQIRAVFFNGTKAETAFRGHVLAKLQELSRDIRFVRLPSTSPAHAGKSFAEKLAAWKAVAQESRRTAEQ